MLEMLRQIAMDLLNSDGRVISEEQQAMASTYEQLNRIALDEYEQFKTNKEGSAVAQTEGAERSSSESGSTESVPVQLATKEETWNLTNESGMPENPPASNTSEQEPETVAIDMSRMENADIVGTIQNYSEDQAGKSIQKQGKGQEGKNVRKHGKDNVSKSGRKHSKDHDEKLVHISDSTHVEKEEIMEENAVQTIMSVEDIVAELNDCNKGEDVIKSLELSIGENGGSYIAIRLSAGVISDLVGEQITEDMPVMISGNCINVAFFKEIIRVDLLKGDVSRKQSTNATVDTINQSINEIGQRNIDRIHSNENLKEILDKILYIKRDSNIAWINAELKHVNSRLSIVDTEDGSKSVLDGCEVVHSLQEVLWVLSF